MATLSDHLWSRSRLNTDKHDSVTLEEGPGGGPWDTLVISASGYGNDRLSLEAVWVDQGSVEGEALSLGHSDCCHLHLSF